MEDLFKNIGDFFSKQCLYILLGIFVFIIGLFAIRGIKITCTKIFKRQNKDSSQASFIISMIDFVLKIVLLIISLSIMNVNSTSILAVISTCAIAIGLALKDSLSNIASGIIIVYNKPFKESDFVDINGISGNIISINLFNTILCTTDNKKIVIPNSTVLNNPLTNYDSRPTRRVDFIFSVSYQSDIEKVKNVIKEIINKHDKILKHPEPFVRLNTQSSITLDFAVKVWVMNPDYWTVYFDLTEQVYSAFKKNKIGIAVNQLEVNIKKQGTKK